MDKGQEPIYTKGHYYLIYDKAQRGKRKYKIICSIDNNCHAHMYNKKSSIRAIEDAHSQNVPMDSSIDYLRTLERLAYNQMHRTKIAQLINTKIDKKVDNQSHYINIQRNSVQ